MATPTTPGFSPSTPPAQPLPYSGPQEPQGGAPEAQAPQQGQPLQSPAPPILQLLGGWHRVSGEIGQHHPQIASMMQKVASATREALTILAREHVGGGIQQGQGQGLPTAL
jgi:hypothetical protein